MRKILAELNSFLQEHISGMKIIQLFNVQTKKLLQFKNISKKLYKSYFREIIIFSLFRPSTYFLYGISICLIMVFGGKNVLAGTLTFGTLYIFVHYIQLFFQPIQELAEQFNVLQSAIASSERFFLLLKDKSIIPNKKKAIKIDKIRGNIKFKNVWFSYNDDEWILKNISFNIKEGEKIALVGHTGSGKSTIINLLGRYYEIKKGEITIDGYNIKDIDLDCLRKNIGLVMQDVFIFTGSIKNNIRLLNENITDEQIKESSSFVNADKFINRYKDNYIHHVSERGSTLSTGQRQLLSFARAISFNPSILVLDEATSNIDTETEFLIQDALTKILKNKTSIVVAHRLSTIKNCDKIIVLHKGKIKEIGNHKTLISKKGIYYNLYKLNYDLE
jgi:ABC-type multidrug transport system fused ATPase/permease subunit